jgi:hypothetical protein
MVVAWCLYLEKGAEEEGQVLNEILFLVRSLPVGLLQNNKIYFTQPPYPSIGPLPYPYTQKIYILPLPSLKQSINHCYIVRKGNGVPAYLYVYALLY